MSEIQRYPKRLIEVDLPIKRISAHARREKSIRHGHISTLHIWWARRPLAACRAVICAALWPDPAEPLCPQEFRKTACEQMQQWATQHLQLCGEESYKRFVAIQKDPTKLDDNATLRQALLDFIADFSNWDNSTVREYLDTSRALTQAAHEALGGAPGTRPLVVDPFAGGDSIPLEALRVGADAFASDLNPVAVLLNKVVLEYIPKYGQRLAAEVRKWGEWIRKEAEKELAEFYPRDPDGATPIAYLWARTIQCEGPGCGAEVPLIRSLWLAKKANRSVALQLVPRPKAKRVDFQVIVKQSAGWVDQGDPSTTIEDPDFDGTVKRGSATCPCCGYTTPVARVREQLKTRLGGAGDARLMCVVGLRDGEQGRVYRLATQHDASAVERADSQMQRVSATARRGAHPVPDEELPLMSGVFNVPLYGHATWGSLFTPRQALMLVTLARLVQTAPLPGHDELPDAVKTCLALVVDKVADKSSSLCRWKASAEYMAGNTFGRQALGMVFDFCEANVFGSATGDIAAEFQWVVELIEHVVASELPGGHVEKDSATSHPLPSDSTQVLFTDPPYYNAVPYADLSDFFLVWLNRSLGEVHPDLLESALSPKDQEICQMSGWDPRRYSHKTKAFFEGEMGKAMAEGRRILCPSGIGVVVFAHKSTAGWEAQLQSMVDAGWIMTGSWPIDTEMGSRLRAMDSAALASSVHLVCRPRENPDGSVCTDEVGDWRDVLGELPRRIHDWMPRLAEEGIVGADAIFACLGPALEIFSRYSRVEKASGEGVTLKEYLEQVWAAVAREALSTVLRDVDASGLEPDARLWVIWLWTLGGQGGEAVRDEADEAEDEEATEAEVSGAKTGSGFVLEYDAARKLAQGLGAKLEDLTQAVEVKGDKARLLPVAERAKYLFGTTDGVPATKKTAKKKQMALFADLETVAESQGWGEGGTPKVGTTTLDRVHQAMLLFASGRSEALRRFLVEEGVGTQAQFWKLAQSLSALYPSGSDEKRWVDGMLARTKTLGFG